MRPGSCCSRSAWRTMFRLTTGQANSISLILELAFGLGKWLVDTGDKRLREKVEASRLFAGSLLAKPVSLTIKIVWKLVLQGRSPEQ